MARAALKNDPDINGGEWHIECVLVGKSGHPRESSRFTLIFAESQMKKGEQLAFCIRERSREVLRKMGVKV